MTKIILAAASVLAASVSMAPADELGSINQSGPGAPIQATGSGSIDFTPTTSIGMTRDYTAAENSPWKRFGDGELSPVSNAGSLGIDFQPTGSIGTMNRSDYIMQSGSPWEHFGDAAPVWQVLE
jgi:hypothetical protein